MKPKSMLAERTVIRAFSSDEEILLWVEGSLPSQGFAVEVEESLLASDPAAFVVKRTEKPGVWPQVTTPFTYWETFRLPPHRTTVRIHHAGGTDDVPIEHAQVDLATLVRKLSCREEPVPDDRVPEPAEPPGTIFTGRSSAVRGELVPSQAIDEAFADALRQIPPENFLAVRIEEITASFGGVTGMSQLVLKVRKI